MVEHGATRHPGLIALLVCVARTLGDRQSFYRTETMGCSSFEQRSRQDVHLSVAADGRDDYRRSPETRHGKVA